MAGALSNLDRFTTIFARDDPRGGNYYDSGVLPAPPGGIVPNFDNPMSIKNQLAIPNIITYTIAMVFVILRLCVRAFINRSLGWDDYFALIATVLVTAHFVSIIEREYSKLPVLWDLAQLMIYLGASTAVKIAILLLYLRLFSVSRSLRWSIYGIGIFVTCVFISGELSIIFACKPIRRVWDLTTPGTCVSVTTEAIAQGFLALFSDVVIVFIPIRTVWMLALPLKTKLAVMGIFAIGLFVCGVGAARVQNIWYSLHRFKKTDPEYYDVTWFGLEGYVWGVLELNMSLIGCCAPTLRPLYSKFIPWLRQKSYFSFRRSTGTNSSSKKSQIVPKPGYESPKSADQSDGDVRLVRGSQMELGEEGKNETMVTAASTHSGRDLDANNITKTMSVDVRGEKS
ncbi:MAG: hypothetical protein M1829_003967 [Trizodia sp. TS-e1964]|nr:MAG: hypothetical protein M1829_003967 [Trizodia sp. TS-e1964]